MRFRFCGDLDCPDWLLLEISLLSVLESSKIDVITKQIIGCCLMGRFDEESVLRVAEQNTEDGISDIKGTVAAIHFMISNATKYDVDEVSLSQEIQQLGLPKANADVISQCFRENKDILRNKLSEESYRVSKVLSSGWRIDQIIASSDEIDSECTAHIKLEVDTKPEDEGMAGVENIAFELSEDKLNLMVQELSTAQKLLEGMVAVDK